MRRLPCCKTKGTAGTPSHESLGATTAQDSVIVGCFFLLRVARISAPGYGVQPINIKISNRARLILLQFAAHTQVKNEDEAGKRRRVCECLLGGWRTVRAGLESAAKWTDDESERTQSFGVDSQTARDVGDLIADMIKQGNLTGEQSWAMLDLRDDLRRELDAVKAANGATEVRA